MRAATDHEETGRRRWRWWVQGLLFALITTAAAIVVWGQIARPHDDVLSRFVADRGWRMTDGYDVQGGVRLGWGIEMDVAIAQRMGLLSRGLEFLLQSEPGGEDVSVAFDGNDIVIQSPRIADSPRVFDRTLRVFWDWLDVVDRNAPPGTIRLRFDDSRREDLRARTTRAKLNQLWSFTDAFCNQCPLIYLGSRW